MDFPLHTAKKPSLVTLIVRSDKRIKVRVQVLNPNKPNTKYTDRVHELRQNKEAFYIRMPQTPDDVIVRINPDVEVKLELLNANLRIVPPTLSPLYQALSVRKWTGADSQKAKKFIEFAQPFCENAGILSSSDSIYVSNDWKFRIDYKDRLMDDNGTESNTPARISQDHGTIEINRRRFVNYTVPMRMAILLHEFSHFYLNANMASEMEADKNAFFVYLGLGYPRIDGLNAFGEIFYTTSKTTNNPQWEEAAKARWNALKQFCEDFEKHPFKIDYN